MLQRPFKLYFQKNLACMKTVKHVKYFSCRGWSMSWNLTFHLFTGIMGHCFWKFLTVYFIEHLKPQIWDILSFLIFLLTLISVPNLLPWLHSAHPVFSFIKNVKVYYDLSSSYCAYTQQKLTVVQRGTETELGSLTGWVGTVCTWLAFRGGVAAAHALFPVS